MFNLNVLVLSGPEIPPLSLTNALTSLRSILFPHYTVQPITQSALALQPWRSSCALIVLPQIQSALGPIINEQIGDFVEAGGKCLILGARVRLEPQLQPSSLQQGINERLTEIRRSKDIGSVIGQAAEPVPSFKANAVPDASEGKDTPSFRLQFSNEEDHFYIVVKKPVDSVIDDKFSLAAVTSSDDVEFKCLDSVGDGNLVGFDTLKNHTVLARYNNGGPACLSMKMNEGRLTLLSPSIEFPLTQESADDLESLESSRLQFFRLVLRDLGLNVTMNVPNATSSLPSHPLPQLLTSTPHHSITLSRMMRSAFNLDPDMKGFHQDAQDEFQFYPFEAGHASDLFTTSRNSTGNAVNRDVKRILVCKDGDLPDQKFTPLFDLNTYYETLCYSREELGLNEHEEGKWGIGEVLLYGEVVTSTQTLLDKNPLLMSRLPIPILSLASHQLAGRGRGSNTWLSPAGCLQFSLLLHLPVANPAFPTSKLVFIQYLFALAVLEACRDERLLGKSVGSKVRVKWPNDLYADIGKDGKEEFTKVGGILVNTNFEGGKVDIVIGCGLNVLNKPPIPSLALVHELNAGNRKMCLNLESTAAVIMTQFESMWKVFLRERSFEPFMKLYLDRWLHSDQRVLLTTTNPHMTVRIVGITSDYGLLRTVPEGRTTFDPWSRWSGETEYVDLQPDGNSFDLMAGLIKTKS